MFLELIPKGEEEQTNHSEKEHELATILAYGASVKMDWLELFKQARAEVVTLRQEVANLKKQAKRQFESLVQMKLVEISGATSNGRVWIRACGGNLGPVHYQVDVLGQANEAAVAASGADLESVLTELYSKYDAAVKGCQTSQS